MLLISGKVPGVLAWGNEKFPNSKFSSQGKVFRFPRFFITKLTALIEISEKKFLIEFKNLF